MLQPKRYLIRYYTDMDSLDAVVRDARLAAGLSQRALAQRAETSQPAVARYERGIATPSWQTLQRLVAACGQRLRLSTEVAPDAHDVELAMQQLELPPLQRLRALSRYARLRKLTSERA
jgi:transcriptional regulator with XRE-family HTH domain